jgi:hypothetical protein
LAKIRTIEELARYINKYMRSQPPRILAAGDLYHRSGIHWNMDLREKLRMHLGWGKTRFRNFSLIAENRALWRNKKTAPRSFLSLSELSRSKPDDLQYFFDRGLVSTKTTAAQARALIATYDRPRPVVRPAREDVGAQLRSDPVDFFATNPSPRQDKRLVNRYAAKIKKLLKGTVGNFLEAATKCDDFVRFHRHLVPLLIEELDMCNSTFWKIRRCAEIVYCGGDTHNLPIARDPLYCISKINPSELKEALRQGIFSRRTIAKQVPKILAEFRAKSISTKDSKPSGKKKRTPEHDDAQHAKVSL